MIIINVIYLIIFLLVFRYLRFFHLKDMPSWTMPLAFLIKIATGIIFSYVYIYSIKQNSEPSDTIRYLNESKQLYDVFFKSPTDFFSLLTGIGDNQLMFHKYMNNTFIWDAGNFTTINDSRNFIRLQSIIHFISFGSNFVHTIIMCFLSLFGIHQLYISIQPYSKLKPILLFFSILLLPSLLFWTSGVLKEPILIVGIGLLSKALMLNDKVIKRFLLGGIGTILIIAFKPYIFLCLIPSFIFIIIYKYIFKQRLIISLFSFLVITVCMVMLFPTKRQAITEYLSRKQFDQENVGKGGIHVYAKNGYYYFKPHQYKNIQINDEFVKLIHPSEAIFLSVNSKEIPIPIHLKPDGKKWRIHIIMPGTNSYIKTTPIDNSFSQLIKNIPEAFVNSFFRPFPLDSGGFLKYLAMIEVWLLICFLIFSFYKKGEIESNKMGIIVSIFIFSLCLMLLIGWTNSVIGAIVRFRFPAQLALFIIGAMLINSKILNKKQLNE